MPSTAPQQYVHRSLYYRSLSRPYRDSCPTKRCPKCCSYSFVAVIGPRSAMATGPTHTAKVYIFDQPAALSCPLFDFSSRLLSRVHLNNTTPAQFTMLFSSRTSQASQSVVDAAMTTTRARSETTITVLEEEFGMHEVPKAKTRFGATASSSFFLTLVLRSY